jgi:hypothetical protein
MQQPPNPNSLYPQFQQQWQQQPNYSQPQTYYPPQQPYPPQQNPPLKQPQDRPQQPPVRPSPLLSRITWLLIGVAIGLVFGLVLGSSFEKSTPTTLSTATTQDAAQSTSQSQPTQALAQATPTPIPTIAPISLSGVGQQASKKFQLQQGLAIFKLTHNGSSNFIVQLLGSNGQNIDNLVNEIGLFNGSKAEGIQNAGTYVLDIQADGKWTVTIQQPRPTTAPYITSFHGKGQTATELFNMNSGLKTIQMTHDGTSNFIIDILDSNGNDVDNIVNEIGSFNGSKAEGIQNDGIYLFDIQADGNWTINIQ